ncbi:unnamed protein product [Acanthoscelides obtectus]|uniref:PHD-type domain-containing protein n=1 Tax=Acanthoscelides obtectus TaxID=200917 RepID=A0A9P0NUX3_ACAOB|nr:unnamed protein product [Acanthoscelides obtectus]CAK1641318.1 hypothetical protein AOBTE_LOCUS12329 [Acanthoscelides obtectus]
MKNKVPAVATSSQWQQYYQKKEEKKKQEEQLKIERKNKRDQKKELENKKKKLKITAAQNVSKRRISNRRATTKLKNVTKKLFSTNAGNGPVTTEPSISKPSEESWYCLLCETDDQLDMRLCYSCLKYYHEFCLGLTEADTEEFQCPFCQ